MQLTMKSIQQNEGGILKSRMFPCSWWNVAHGRFVGGIKTLDWIMRHLLLVLRMLWHSYSSIRRHPCSLRAFMLACWIGKDLTIISDHYKYQSRAGDRKRTLGKIKKTTLRITQLLERAKPSWCGNEYVPFLSGFPFITFIMTKPPFGLQGFLNLEHPNIIVKIFITEGTDSTVS